jgi:hypothetical protein
LTENIIPKPVNGLVIFDAKYANGSNGAVQQKTNRFFERTGIFHNCITKIAHPLHKMLPLLNYRQEDWWTAQFQLGYLYFHVLQFWLQGYCYWRYLSYR